MADGLEWRLKSLREGHYEWRRAWWWWVPIIGRWAPTRRVEVTDYEYDDN